MKLETTRSLVCGVLFVCVALLPTCGYAQNVKYTFEDDREIETKGNVHYVESQAQYTRKQLDVLNKRYAELVKRIEALEHTLTEMKKESKKNDKSSI